MHRLVLIWIFMFVGLAFAGARTGNINPKPQEISKGDPFLFEIPVSWKVVCDRSLEGGHAVSLLDRAGVPVDSGASFKVVLGVRGDRSVRRYAKNIPDRSEGYWLSVTPGNVVVAGNDPAGLFWGVQSLLDIMEDGKLESCTIRDWPDVPFRGVVEGFYGKPWSHEARLDQLEFYRENKMNVYMYGPKDDPYHREHWREPYPEKEGRQISELAERAKSCGVNFYWALHPGFDLKWTQEDRNHILAKFEMMYQLGVRSFAVFFDDIPWADGKAENQASLLNYIDDNFIKVKPDVAPLVVCPTQYNKLWAVQNEDYLWTMGEKLNQGIELMWTGDKVVINIDNGTMDWFNERVQRKGYVWWNYPVNDFVRSNILLGPVYGNDLDIADKMSGFLSNPMEHAEASKIALYGIADYTWNMEAYDYLQNWEDAIADLLPDNAWALRTFALYNKGLDANWHIFDRKEGEELKETAGKALDGDKEAINALMAKADELKLAADLLIADRSNPRLNMELMPWLLQARLLADYGRCVCTLALNDDPAVFDVLYRQALSIREQMYVLGTTSDTRHFLQVDVRLGTKVFIPALEGLFANSVRACNRTNGTSYDTAADYRPYVIASDVPQLAVLSVVTENNDVKVADPLETVDWLNGGEFIVSMDHPVVLDNLVFDVGTVGLADKFSLEIMADGEWEVIGLHYNSGKETRLDADKVIKGRTVSKVRLKNISGEDLKVLFKGFKMVTNQAIVYKK